jgi:ubiquinone/menaquinone biosynthesis C-methylase UbiE
MLERVGEYGEVFAIDVFAPKLSMILNEARRRGHNNLNVIHADLESQTGTHLRDQSVDRVAMTNFLHEVSDKDAVIREAARILSREGKLIVIDWISAHGLIGPERKMLVSPLEIEKIAEKNRLTFERQFEAGDYHYGLVFKFAN